MELSGFLKPFLYGIKIVCRWGRLFPIDYDNDNDSDIQQRSGIRIGSRDLGASTFKRLNINDRENFEP